MPSSTNAPRIGRASRIRRAETGMSTADTRGGPGSSHGKGGSRAGRSRAGGSGADGSGPGGQEGPLTWLVPSSYDASAASLSAHSDAIGQMMAGRARLWLGPFDPPSELPAGFEDTALVVPTSGSTGVAKAVALSRTALLASQDATAQLLAEDPALAASGGHGVWLPLQIGRASCRERGEAGAGRGSGES